MSVPRKPRRNASRSQDDPRKLRISVRIRIEVSIIIAAGAIATATWTEPFWLG